MNKIHHRRMKFALAFAAMGWFVACGDGGELTGPDENLTPSEAEALTGYFVGSAFSGWSFGQIGGGASVAPRFSGSGGGAPTTIDFQLNVTNACAEGGSVSVAGSIEGTIDDQTRSGTLSLGITTSAADCRIPVENTVFTVSTSPDLRMDGELAWQDGQPSGPQTFSFAGAIHWTSEDGRSGSCVIDLQVVRAEDGSLSESGTVCESTVGGGL